MKAHLHMLLAYKRWANALIFDAVAALPAGAAGAPRATRWESIAYTLSHVIVVDDLFRRHLEGRTHSYTYRNIDERLALPELRRRQEEVDDWLLHYVDRLDHAALDEIVRFTFVGGGEGAMSRAEILYHLVNHGTYHRGLVSDMLCQVPAEMPANDLPVFLRDVWHASDGVPVKVLRS